jgi:hypothetical protein
MNPENKSPCASGPTVSLLDVTVRKISATICNNDLTDSFRKYQGSQLLTDLSHIAA